MTVPTKTTVAWPDWEVLRVSGPDRHDFLNRLTTNQVTPGQTTAHTFLLSVQGKPLVEMWLHDVGEQTLIEVPKGLAQTAFTELDKFHFGEKLTIEPVPEWSVLCHLGPDKPSYDYAFKTERLAAEAWSVVKEGPLEGDAKGELEKLRIAQGTPRFGVDYDQDTLFLEFASPDSYSEDKGCYPGQEVVARILHRGRVNRRLVGLSFDRPGVETGSKFVVDGKEVGWVTSLWETIGLGYVRREHNEPGSRLITSDGFSAAVVELPHKIGGG